VICILTLPAASANRKYSPPTTRTYRFESCTAAERTTKISRKKISALCDAGGGGAGDFEWRFAPSVDDEGVYGDVNELEKYLNNKSYGKTKPAVESRSRHTATAVAAANTTTSAEPNPSAISLDDFDQDDMISDASPRVESDDVDARQQPIVVAKVKRGAKFTFSIYGSDGKKVDSFGMIGDVIPYITPPNKSHKAGALGVRQIQSLLIDLGGGRITDRWWLFPGKEASVQVKESDHIFEFIDAPPSSATPPRRKDNSKPPSRIPAEVQAPIFIAGGPLEISESTKKLKRISVKVSSMVPKKGFVRPPPPESHPLELPPGHPLIGVQSGASSTPSLCIVCQTKPVVALVLPCRHAVLCRDCGYSFQNIIITNKFAKCIVCQTKIHDAQHVVLVEPPVPMEPQPVAINDFAINDVASNGVASNNGASNDAASNDFPSNDVAQARQPQDADHRPPLFEEVEMPAAYFTAPKKKHKSEREPSVQEKPPPDKPKSMVL
jgi:hypothetical protein